MIKNQHIKIGKSIPLHIWLILAQLHLNQTHAQKEDRLLVQQDQNALICCVLISRLGLPGWWCVWDNWWYSVNRSLVWAAWVPTRYDASLDQRSCHYMLEYALQTHVALCYCSKHCHMSSTQSKWYIYEISRFWNEIQQYFVGYSKSGYNFK